MEQQLLQHQLNQATIEAELESWVQREGGLREDEQQLEVGGR